MFAKELASSTKMSLVFPQSQLPVEYHVHILVDLPPSKNLSLKSPPSWLVEIHSELWGRHDLYGKIFHTATLTKDDFTELQVLLDKQNPERISDSYVAEDVLATKSAFLCIKSTPLSTDFGNGLAP